MSEEVKDIEQLELVQNQTSNYRSIFKATSLFGGVQVYNILIGVVRSKFLAVLLGPAGMGIQGLYQSTLDVVKSLTAFGLEQSAVRDISEANGSGDTRKINNTVATVRRLVWITGLLGFLVTLILSPLLSQWTFGNNDYTLGFIILSTTLLLNQLCSGQKVLLQGMRRLKDLAKASAIGATIGLIVSVPLYYWIGVKGIVPTMVLVSITALLLSWHYSHKIPVEKSKLTTKKAVIYGASMIKMGVAMSISNILVTISAYILRWFIRQQGGVDEVGLFTAGILITNTYVGMFFNAMSTDYYPRLSAVNKDNEKCKEVINQQGEIALLLIAPVILSCIVFMPFIIKLIYSHDFLAANSFITFAVSGMVFKASSFVISYAFLAKAESRLFIVNEVVSNLYFLALYVIGYYVGGLQGLGIAYMVGYFIYFIQVYLISHLRYHFQFTKSFLRIFGAQIVSVAVSLMVAFTMSGAWFYVSEIAVLGLCAFSSIKELDKRIHVLEFVDTKISKI